MRRQFFIAIITAVITFITLHITIGSRYQYYGWGRYHYWGRPYGPPGYYGPWGNDYWRYPPGERPAEPGQREYRNAPDTSRSFHY
jgi:hypothetical protein